MHKNNANGFSSMVLLEQIKISNDISIILHIYALLC